ncbi:putative reverse transcriptase domain-containing protein [Tanacetum coccineum]
MMTDKYCPRGEIKKLEFEMWNLKVKGNDVVAYSQRFQELALMCDRMFLEEIDQVEKYVGGLPDTIHGRNGDRKPYGGPKPLCSKCNYHHEGPCAPKCSKCNRFGHLGRDCRSPPNVNTGANQRACFECGAQRAFQEVMCPNVEHINRGVMRLEMPRLGQRCMPWAMQGQTRTTMSSRLAKYHAVIVCAEKIVSIPFGDEILIVRGGGKPELEDVPVVQNFPEVFPETLPGFSTVPKIRNYAEHTAGTYGQGVIRPISTPSGSAGSVVKKKDGSSAASKAKAVHLSWPNLREAKISSQTAMLQKRARALCIECKEKRKEREPLRVRALVMTIGLDLPKQILRAQNEARKPKTSRRRMLGGIWLEFKRSENLDNGKVGTTCGWNYVSVKMYQVITGPELVQETTERIIQIKQRIQTAHDRQKSYADLKRKPMEFQVWSYNYAKGFTLERGPVAYKLELPQELSRVHNTFHVSNLKKCYSDDPLVVPLEGLQVDDKLQFCDRAVRNHG